MAGMLMDHSIDPKQKIIDEIGDLSEVEIFNNQVLCAVYVRPNKTKGGIMLADQTTAEDRFQGKVGLILKTGPSAFNDDTGEWFNGTNFNIGDWIVLRPSDGWSITVNGVLCRMLSDTQVKMRIPTPDAAW